MAYKYLQCIILTSTFLTSIISGGLLIKNYEEIKNDIYDYSTNEKINLSIVIYLELFYLLFVLYCVLKIIWTGIVSCWTDDYDNRPRFNLIYLVLILLCLLGNGYLFYNIIKYKKIINYEFTTTSSFLIGNCLFAILVSSINKLYYVCCKKKQNINYNNL